MDDDINISIIKYNDSYEKEWDRFVLEKSVNGTFLQTRRFLNYHPEGRFEDESLMVIKGDNIIAVCPACVCQEGKKRKLISHKGSTFGGIIIASTYYHTEKVMQIIKLFDEYFSSNYDSILLKQTSRLFSVNDVDLLEFVLHYYGFYSYDELNLAVNLHKLHENVIESFDRNKRRNINKCEKYEVSFRKLENDNEIDCFHNLLEKNLSKYGLVPIHTAKELMEFRNSRLKDETQFYGVFEGNKMMAAGMMFVFSRTNVIHAQNLSADYTFDKYSPVTYLYYKVIEKAKKDGFDKLSWGISTEDCGRKVNMGLVRNKESYGSEYEIKRTFFKDYSRNDMGDKLCKL